MPAPDAPAGRLHPGWWADIRRRHQHLYGPVLERIRDEGPLAASAFRDPDGPPWGSWWDWALAKHVLEDLFDQGTVLVHDRVNFERRYDLAERVLPPGTDTSEPTAAEAASQLTLLARHLGVGNAADLADYYRLRPAEARAALAETVAAGLLQEVAVEGWAGRPTCSGTPVPRRVAHLPVLLSPFDFADLVAERTLRLFGFRYRLECARRKRVHGYYTMPVLAGGRLVARVDLKHDRQAGVLVLRNLHLEPGPDPAEAGRDRRRRHPAGRPPGRRRGGGRRRHARHPGQAAARHAAGVTRRTAKGGERMIPQRKGLASRQAHVDLPEGTVEEEHGRQAFGGRASHLYRTAPPTAWVKVEGPLRLWAFDWNQLTPPDQTDPEGDPLVVLSNRDLTVLVSRRSAPMPYFVRDADGDVVYFVHRGEGTLETDYGPLRFRPGDYLVVPKGTTHRVVPTAGDNFSC